MRLPCRRARFGEVPPAGTVDRSANVTADGLVRRDPDIIERARPHVRAIRGMTVDQLQLYGIENGLTQHVLVVADALAQEASRVLD